LIVCSSGIGSSRILAARLKKSVDNIEIVDEVSALSFEKNKTARKDIDLVISTVPLNYEGEVVVVTPVLFPEEIEKIRSIIKNIAAGRRPAEEKRRGKFLPGLEDKLEITARIAGDIVGILKNFKVVKVSKIETPADIIKRASEKNFLPQGSDSKEVFEALTRRERLGSTLIPEVNLALLHARTDGVKQPFIGLLALDKSVLISGDEVDRIIVLLAPKSLLPEELELISSFSASIIENREFNAIIREADENKFLEYLRNLMGGYYNEVINKGGEK
jgi:mannitol operon transcriptional antiterminator